MENQALKKNIPSAATLNLTKVYLKSSNFIKGEIKDVGKMKLKIDVDHSSEVDDEGTFEVTEIISLSSEESIFNFEVQMTASFAKISEGNFDAEKFSYLNAAPIIYAYVRQHISYTTLMAGMKPIVLPLVNFYEYYKKMM